MKTAQAAHLNISKKKKLHDKRKLDNKMGLTFKDKKIRKPDKKKKLKVKLQLPLPPTTDTDTNVPLRAKISKKKKLQKQQMKSSKLKKEIKLPKVKEDKKTKNLEKKLKQRLKLLPQQENVRQIVPWVSSAEWENVCLLFNKEDFSTAISEILIWSKRASGVPIGVDSTLYLLQAIVYDQNNTDNPDWKAEIARSLYSLAIIRFINHVTLLAANESGDISTRMPMAQLAGTINVPEWLVSLRHQISHGATIPSLEALRVSSTFIKGWLKTNYWISQENQSGGSGGQVLVQHERRSETKQSEISNEIVELVSSFVMLRIHQLRNSQQVITLDPMILQFLSSKSRKIVGPQIKDAILELTRKILTFLRSEPDLTYLIIAEEMVPPTDFYEELGVIFGLIEPFKKLYSIWHPIIEQLMLKGKLLPIIIKLAEIHSSEESADTIRKVSALWIKTLLDKISIEDDDSPIEELKDLLPILLRAPNPSTEIFLQRLYEMIEGNIGSVRLTKLATVTSIWLNDNDETENVSSSNLNYNKSGTNLFTVDDILAYKRIAEEKVNHSPKPWDLDYRDGEKFWARNPLGTIFS